MESFLSSEHFTSNGPSQTNQSIIKLNLSHFQPNHNCVLNVKGLWLCENTLEVFEKGISFDQEGKLRWFRWLVYICIRSMVFNHTRLCVWRTKVSIIWYHLMTDIYIYIIYLEYIFQRIVKWPRSTASLLHVFEDVYNPKYFIGSKENIESYEDIGCM